MDVTALLMSLISTITSLKLEIAVLQEKLNINSQNSSLAPSNSFKKKKTAHQNKSKRKIGAQPGHVGKNRALQQESTVDNVMKISAPIQCTLCKRFLKNSDKHERHQIYDIENNQIKITNRSGYLC